MRRGAVRLSDDEHLPAKKLLAPDDLDALPASWMKRIVDRRFRSLISGSVGRFPLGSGRRTWPWVSGSRRSNTATGCFFTTAAAMLTTLTKALGEGRFDDKLKVFTIPQLLIIDEIGYLPIDRQAATLFFQLISRRYERGPMILCGFR